MKLNIRILWALAIVAFVVGLYGVWMRLTTGHVNVAYGSYVLWGLWVAMYLFFVGTAAGLFLIAALDVPLRVRAFAGVAPVALLGALVSLGAGLAQIWLDLGWMDRIWNVYFSPNFNSVMALITWGYTLFGLLILVALYLTLRGVNQRLLNLLMWIGIPLALYLSGGVGALLGVESSRLFWHVGLFPAQFPVFAVASGVAVMLVVIGLLDAEKSPQCDELLRILAFAMIALQVVKLYFLWADYSQSLYGGVPENVAAVNAVLFGPWAWAFWILQIGVGTLVPLIILAVPSLAKQPALAGWARDVGVARLCSRACQHHLPRDDGAGIRCVASGVHGTRFDVSVFSDHGRMAVGNVARRRGGTRIPGRAKVGVAPVEARVRQFSHRKTISVGAAKEHADVLDRAHQICKRCYPFLR
jgi:molybdopterin-containing oxidoreductase family membrane subunit